MHDSPVNGGLPKSAGHFDTPRNLQYSRRQGKVPARDSTLIALEECLKTSPRPEAVLRPHSATQVMRSPPPAYLGELNTVDPAVPSSRVALISQGLLGTKYQCWSTSLHSCHTRKARRRSRSVSLSSFSFDLLLVFLVLLADAILLEHVFDVLHGDGATRNGCHNVALPPGICL